MDTKMKALLVRMMPYVQQHPNFDIVQTKFGLLQVYDPEGDGICPELIPDYAALRDVLIHEIAGDVREESGLQHLDVNLHPAEAEETARRVMAYLSDPEDLQALRRYLADDMRREGWG